MSMRSRHASGPSMGVSLSLIVTPMLDMAFQILAFFIMTYHPSALEGHIPGSLAPPDKSASTGKENVLDTSAVPVPEEMLLPELAEAITVKVKAVGAGQTVGDRLTGQPSQIFLRRTTDPNPQVVAEADASIAQGMKKLEATLREIQKANDGEKANIKLEAEAELRQEYVMQIYDVCKRAGFAKVHFVPPPIDRAPK